MKAKVALKIFFIDTEAEMPDMKLAYKNIRYALSYPIDGLNLINKEVEKASKKDIKGSILLFTLLIGKDSYLSLYREDLKEGNNFYMEFKVKGFHGDYNKIYKFID